VRALSCAAVAAPPLLVALLTAPIAFQGGTILPWHPQMIDLDVYRDAGALVLSGGDLYAHTDGLPFLYPPAAALLSVPFTAMGQVAAQLCWLAMCVAGLLAILYRLGLSGWPLSLVAAAVIYFCEPVSQTLAYGQLGIVLVTLVVLDLVPGRSLVPEVLRARLRLPAGALTGLATSLKLTPALFAVYLLAAGHPRPEAGTQTGRPEAGTQTGRPEAGIRTGRPQGGIQTGGPQAGIGTRRPALGIAATALGVAAVAAVALPGASAHYWSRLAHGDTGLPAESIVYLTNQSVLGTWLRIVGLGGVRTATGLLLAVAVAGVGVYAAARWHRRGKVAFAVTICGVAGLLASPVSWSHHFVWVVPLGVVLLDPGLPAVTRAFGWVFVGWVSAAPFHRLPLGHAVELTYHGWQLALASFTALSGIAFLSVTLISTLTTSEVPGPAADRTPAPSETRKRAGNTRATHPSYVGPHG
jgi:alpha-1,2-mannosyltransferase